MTDAKKKIHKDSLTKLRDAYVEMTSVFHALNHYQISKYLHDAIFPTNQAIKMLENLLEDES